MVYAFLAVLAGAMISSQSSCNGVLYPYIGVLGVGFISPFLNAVFSYIFHLVSEKKPLRLNGMPVHASFGGFCSVFVLGLSGYCVARLGTAVSVCLSVSGQLFMSAIVDHFGLFGTEKVSFHSIRIPGFLCILAGIFIINFAGADSFSSIDSRGILFLMAASGPCHRLVSQSWPACLLTKPPATWAGSEQAASILWWDLPAPWS